MRFRFTLNNTIEGSNVLTREPKGWDKTEIVTRRDQKYHGIFREFSVKLEFYWGGGKEYIDEIYNTQGQDALVTLTIEIDCNGSGTYEVLFNGKLNLKTWRSFGNIGQKDSFTSVDIIETGITETVKERLKTKINLSELTTLDGTALSTFTYGPYDLTLHSKAIVKSALLTTVASAPQYTEFTLFLTGSDMWAELPFDSTTYDELGDVIIQSAPFVSATTTGTTPEAVYTNTTGGTLTVELDYNFIGSVVESEDNNRAYNLFLKYKKGTGGFAASAETTLVTYGAKTPVGNVAMTQAVNTNGTLSLSFADTESIYIYFEFEDYNGTVPVDPFVQMSFTTCQIEFSTETTTASTTSKVFAIHEAGARIAQSITNQTDAFRSDYFGRTNSQPNTYTSNGCGAFTALTNGFQIRKFPIADRPVFMSMDDYYEGLNAIHNLGMSVELGGSGYVIRVEPKEYFYSANVILRIGNIPDIEVSNAENYYYNSLQVGYEKWETENLNGLDEFNSKRRYNINVNSDKELMCLSKLVAGGYPLEIARRKLYVDEKTTDYEYDNENFIICLSREVDSGNPILTTAEKDENYTAVNNLISPTTSYNLRISPARNALRWNSVLSAGLIKKAGTNLKLVYNEGNGAMESEFTADTCEGNYNNELLLENQDIQWDGVNTNNLPIWIPEIYEFDFPLSFTDYKNIKANPTYCLEISRTNTDFIKAYILEIRYKPVNGMASFKLLRANA